jgi:hypothetical protein
MRLQLVSDQVRKILRSMKNSQNHYSIMANDAKKHCFADLNRDLLATDQRPGASEIYWQRINVPELPKWVLAP